MTETALFVLLAVLVTIMLIAVIVVLSCCKMSGDLSEEERLEMEYDEIA